MKRIQKKRISKRDVGRGIQMAGFMSTFFLAGPLASLDDLTYFALAVTGAIAAMILGAIMEVM